MTSSIVGMIWLICLGLVVLSWATAVMLRLRVTSSVDTALLAAFVACSAAMYLAAELLGLANGFTSPVLRWCLLGLVLGASLWTWRDTLLRESIVSVFRSAIVLVRRQAAWVFLNALGVVLILMYAPANWDAMNFHMTRAAQWLQQGSLAHFPTHFVPQLDRPPVAEVLMAWARGLSGTWDSAPLIQWASCVIVALAIRSCIIRMIGPLSRLEEATVLIAVGLSPMIIAQSTTPQVDLASLAFVGCGAALTAEFVRTRSSLILPFASLAFGLAVATKGTAVVGLVAVVAGITPAIFQRLRAAVRSGSTWRQATTARVLVVGALSIAGLVLPFAPTMARNLSSFDSIAGPEQGSLVVSTNDPRLVLANSLRQLGPNLQFGEPGGLGIVLSRAELKVVRNLAEFVGGSEAETSTDINHFSADPWAETRPRTVSFPTITAPEDFVGSPLAYNFALLGLVVAAFVWRRFARQDRHAIIVALIIVCVAVLASGKIAKLQYWGNRLTLPVTAAMLVLALIAAIQIGRTTKVGKYGLVTVLLVGTWSWLAVDLVGPVRPLIATDDPLFKSVSEARRWDTSYDRYFHGGVGLGADFELLENYVNDNRCQEFAIGSFIGVEFPLWVIADRTGAKIVHTGPTVGPPSSESAQPCVVVRQNADGAPSDLEMPYGYLAIEVID